VLLVLLDILIGGTISCCKGERGKKKGVQDTTFYVMKKPLVNNCPSGPDVVI